MTRQTQHSEDNSQLLLPQSLKDDLVRLYGAGVPVPLEVDEAVLTVARQHMVRRQRAWLVLRRVGLVGTAAAAAVGLAVQVWKPWHGQTPKAAAPGMPGMMSSVAPLDRRDIDRNGRVDILDAFTLARHVQRGDQRQGVWDVNGDGVVDKGDVDAVAMAAVSLKGGAS